MGEVIDHRRGHDLHVVPFAGINEDVGFNHRHITEEAVYVLRRDQSNLTRFNQIIQGGHAFALTDFLRPADTCVHIDHEHVLAYPPLPQQVFDHVYCLQGGGDVADLSFGRLAIVHCRRSSDREGLEFIRIYWLFRAFQCSGHRSSSFQ